MKTIDEFLQDLEEETYRLENLLKKKYVFDSHAILLERIILEIDSKKVSEKIIDCLRNPENLYDGSMIKLLDLYKKIILLDANIGAESSEK